MKRFDLMMDVNLRGTFVCSQACLPHLAKAANPAYSDPLSAARYARQVVRSVRGLHHGEIWYEYVRARHGGGISPVGVSRSTRSGRVPSSATAALQVIPGAEPERGRTPEIMADAACIFLTRDSRTTTGNFFIDEEVLAEAGMTDLSGYAISPGMPLRTDLFLD